MKQKRAKAGKKSMKEHCAPSSKRILSPALTELAEMVAMAVKRQELLTNVAMSVGGTQQDLIMCQAVVAQACWLEYGHLPLIAFYNSALTSSVRSLKVCADQFLLLPLCHRFPSCYMEGC